MVSGKRLWPTGGQVAWTNLETLAACKPLSVCFTSNSTSSPSASVLKPSIVIAEKCTKTSSPSGCSMNPYPLASLNHFTLPLAIGAASYKWDVARENGMAGTEGKAGVSGVQEKIF